MILKGMTWHCKEIQVRCRYCGKLISARKRSRFQCDDCAKDKLDRQQYAKSGRLWRAFYTAVDRRSIVGATQILDEIKTTVRAVRAETISSATAIIQNIKK